MNFPWKCAMVSSEVKEVKKNPGYIQGFSLLLFILLWLLLFFCVSYAFCHTDCVPIYIALLYHLASLESDSLLGISKSDRIRKWRIPQKFSF